MFSISLTETGNPSLTQKYTDFAILKIVICVVDINIIISIANAYDLANKIISVMFMKADITDIITFIKSVPGMWIKLSAAFIQQKNIPIVEYVVSIS